MELGPVNLFKNKEIMYNVGIASVIITIWVVNPLGSSRTQKSGLPEFKFLSKEGLSKNRILLHNFYMMLGQQNLMTYIHYFNNIKFQKINYLKNFHYHLTPFHQRRLAKFHKNGANT